MSVRVKPLLRVVANGTSNGKRRATLIATPQHVPGAAENDPDTVELSDWPAAMATRLAAMGWPVPTSPGRQVWSRTLQPTSVGGWVSHGASLPNAAAYEVGDRWETISTIWRKALAFENDENWRLLAEDIARSLHGRARTSNLAGIYPVEDTKLDPDGALYVPVKPSDPKGIEVVGVVSIPQSDIALEEEGVRAARILRKLHKSPSAFDDTDDDSEKLPDQDYKDNFATAANSANAERRRTRDVKAALGALLTTATKTAAGACANGASTVPTAAAVMGDDDAGRNTRRGNYRYANWL